MTNQQNKELLNDWNFVRSETLELLVALDDEKLLFQPAGKKWQPLSYQFACIGRTQLVYASALQKGSMRLSDFSGKGLPAKQDVTTQEELLHLLTWSNEEWLHAIDTGFPEVKWPTHPLSRAAHVYRLIAHERLHHGQLIGYFTLAGYKFPKNFKNNWAL